MTFFYIIWPSPIKEIVLSKERADEFVQLYTKKRDIISECLKNAEPSIEEKIIDYYGMRNCGIRRWESNKGSFQYKVDQGIINIQLYVEWRLDPDPGEDGETAFEKLKSPEQMTCVKDFFASQGLNLYLDYGEFPHRKFNTIEIRRGKVGELFGNFYDVKNNRALDDNQFCAMTVRHIALLLGAKHGGRPCYDSLNGESPFFPFKDDYEHFVGNVKISQFFKDDYEHFLENAKKDTNDLFLTDRELKNILSPTLSEEKVCELD